jgi:DNA-binding GntR family transcriptional regulator
MRTILSREGTLLARRYFSHDPVYLSAMLTPGPGQVKPPRNLTEDAYEYVRMAILRGRMPVGTIVAEAGVAEALGISKTPVRQALQMLRREGLLEVGRRRQLIVRGFTPEHRDEVLEVREALERIAVRRGCEVMSVDDVDYLHLLLIRQRRAVEAGADDDFVDLDEEFHLRIAEAAGLPIVAKILGQLRGFVRIMRLGSAQVRDARQAIAEHAVIVEAFEARDPDAAVAALVEHLLRARLVDTDDNP